MAAHTWRVQVDADGVPRVVEYGLGRWSDEWRTVCFMRDASIKSHEDAARIVDLFSAGGG